MNKASDYRTLDDFADHIITRQIYRDNGSWHAVLDCGIIEYVSDPEFSHFGIDKSRMAAAKKCADVIRKKAKKESESLSSQYLLAPGYELYYRLMPFWEKKERFEALGIDPNEIISQVRQINMDIWCLEGEWIIKWEATRAMEFEFQLLVAEMENEISVSKEDALVSRDIVISEFKKAVDAGFRFSGTEETWSILRKRVDAKLNEIMSNCAELIDGDVEWRVYGKVNPNSVKYVIWEGVSDNKSIFQVTNAEDQLPGNSGYYHLDSLLKLKGINSDDISIEADVAALSM